MNKEIKVGARNCLAGLVAGLTMALASGQALAADDKPTQVLFKNVNIFDGFSDKLSMGMSGLVEGNYIKEVGKSISAPDAFEVDGDGRTMTPGLIDMHQHVMLNPPEGTAAYQTRWDGAAGGAFAHHHLVNNILMICLSCARATLTTAVRC